MRMQKGILAAACSLAIVGCGFEPQEEVVANPGQGQDEQGQVQNYLTYNNQDIYVNGVNVAWLSFANDFGSADGLDKSRAETVFDQVKAAGGNSVRWWVHTNGTTSPVWSSDGLSVASASEQAGVIEDMKKALDIAESKDMFVIFNLWSFDMLAITQDNVSSVINSNYALLTVSAMRETYIENFIKPLLTEIAGHPALLAIDLFNEAENMTESWFIDREGLGATYPVTLENIHETTAILSAGIHEIADELDKEILVTTGPKSLGMFNSDAKGGVNYYSDARMESYGGDKAALDFYAPHYYDDMGKEGAWSPFYHKPSEWNLDKPIIIAEFFADDDAYKPASFDYFGDPLSEEELCKRLKDYNYAGGLSWQWSKSEYSQSTLNCVTAAADVVIAPTGDKLDFEGAGVPVGVDKATETGGTISLSISDTEANTGDQSLEMYIDENHDGEKKVYLKLPVEGYNFDTITKVKLSIKLSAEASQDYNGIAGGKFFAKDKDWNWSEGAWVSLNPNEWTTVEWDTTLSLPIQELGFQLYGNPGGATVQGSVYFDSGSVSGE